MKSRLTYAFLALLALAPALALAQSAPASGPRIVSSQEHMTNDTALDERLAKDWGLEPEEWTRYRHLMQGPLGIYSPNLDPLTALGIEARTSDERRLGSGYTRTSSVLT